MHISTFWVFFFLLIQHILGPVTKYKLLATRVGQGPELGLGLTRAKG